MKMESFAEVALGIEVATAVTKGARQYQQDSVLTNFPSGQDNGYAIIADGMGGSTDGHLASTLATCSVFEHLKMNAHMTESGASMPTVLLREAAAAANKRIADHTAKAPKTAGMGTTLLVPWIQGNKLFWLSIGDSPFMLFRDGALRMLNQDHSLGSQIDMMVKVGTMDADQGKDHPDRALLTSALEGKEIALIDCPPVPIALQPGDILVAATDGLQFLPNAVIANTLMLTQNGSSMDTANALLNSLDALNDPEQDNAAIVVIKIGLAVGRSTSRGADDIPVLAMAEGATESKAEPAAEPEAAAPAKKKKTFFYRGQEYEKDD